MNAFEEAIDFFNKPGAVAVIPTDTVYGLAARAVDEDAVNNLYELKNREHKPGTLIAANIDQLVNLGLKRRYLKAVEQYWPGAISVVVPCINPELNYLHKGKQSLAVRIPDNQKLLSLLSRTGPLITTSSNNPGQAPAANIQEAKNIFKKKVGLYVDGGDLSNNEASTVIRIVDDEIEVLRQGAVKI